MAIHLRSKLGKTFQTSAGHWTVYLMVAECFGWKSKGTLPPEGFPRSEQWDGNYDSSDAQRVEDSEAKELAKILHGAAAGPHIGQALADVIRHVENSAEQSGITIHPSMRMSPEQFNNEFSPLLFLLYDGEFFIE